MVCPFFYRKSWRMQMQFAAKRFVIDALFTLGRQLFAIQDTVFNTNVCGEAWLFALP